MSEIFFISDSHWGHKGIINFTATKPFRPFETIEEHDVELVKRWNSVVGPKDTVWHLGDVCFGERNMHYISQCNGRKKLVMGNHDMYEMTKYLQYFDRVFGAVEFKGMILTHIPVHEEQLKHRFFLNVHGHLHASNVLKADGTKDMRYFNASCEQINLTPIPYDEILNQWANNN